MSLMTSNYTQMAEAAQDVDNAEARENLARLDRYVAILEDNKNATRFVPDDASLALDMAGFVRTRLRNGRGRPASSIARLALALVQRQPEAPTQ